MYSRVYDIWLCIAVYSHVWLCMTVYDYVWLCMAMYGWGLRIAL